MERLKLRRILNRSEAKQRPSGLEAHPPSLITQTQRSTSGRATHATFLLVLFICVSVCARELLPYEQAPQTLLGRILMTRTVKYCFKLDVG